MKSKVLAVAVLGLLGLVLILNRQQAKANINSVAALDNVFAAINSGEMDPALASFTEDAIAENLVRSETYRGVSEIHQMLQSMGREGRRFDIVDVDINGDTIKARVEVSDRGIVWGSQTIEAILKDDRLQTFSVTAFSLELWRIGQ